MPACREAVMANTPIEKMKPRPHVAFTADRKEVFLENFRQTGVLYISAHAAGVDSVTVHSHIRKDPEFARRAKEAKQLWVDEVLVQEAVRRATKGSHRPIIGGKFRDEVVAEEVVYSDGLMSQLLRANRAEFKEGIGGAVGEGGTGNGTGAAFLVPTAPMTMDEWEAVYGEDARGKTRAEDEAADE